MADFKTNFVALQGDWSLSGKDLASGDGLQTAVVISLFSDRLATVDDGVPGDDLRGWWGDAYPDKPGDLLGSRLWLLSREKQVTAALRHAEAYAKEALQWLVADGVARSVVVTAEIVGSGILGLTITINRSVDPPVKYRFETFWKGN
jgi:phage gp46-like protein